MSTKPVNVEDYRILAQRRLPKIIFDYLEGGADDEIGMKHNREVFERYRLLPRSGRSAAGVKHGQRQVQTTQHQRRCQAARFAN